MEKWRFHCRENGTVGALLKTMRDIKEPTYHKLYHELRDRIVANKDSIFFQYIVDRLAKQNQPDEISLALSFCVLDNFCHRLSECGCTNTEIVTIVHELLHTENTQRNYFAKRAQPDLDKLVGKNLKGLEDCLTPPWVKVCSQSTHLQRVSWKQYHEEIGIKDEFLSAQRAMQHIANTPLTLLESIYPALASRVHKHFINAYRPQATLKTVLAIDPKWLLWELLAGVKKHISNLYVGLDSTETENVYPYFMLSKYICTMRAIFTLNNS